MWSYRCRPYPEFSLHVERDTAMSNPDDPHPGITPSLNGPYLVKDVADLSNSKGSLPAKATMAL